jgi:hypothetical protein
LFGIGDDSKGLKDSWEEVEENELDKEEQMRSKI